MGTQAADAWDERVSGRCMAPLLDALERAGLTLDEVLADLEGDTSGLADASRRMSWARFAEISDRVVHAVGGLEPLREAGRRAVDAPSLALLPRLASLAASPADMYWVAQRWALPNLAPMIEATFERVGPTACRITCWLPDGYRPNAAFFVITAGNFEQVPRLLGQRAGTVTLETDGVRAVFQIVHAPSFTLWSRARSLLNVLFRGREAFDALGSQHQTIAEQLSVAAAAREQAERAIETQTALLTAVSHELRTPLTAVLGLIDLVRADPTSPDVPGHLAVAREQGALLAEVIEDLLAVSVLGRDAHVEAAVEMDLLGVIESAMAPFHPIARDRGIHLSLECGSTLPAVRGPAAQLHTLVHHLVSNAVKFTREGRVVVRLQAESHEEHVEVQIAVHDTGVGIDAAWKERIFAPFVQREQGLRRQATGLGLGLPIARGIAQQLGGDVTGVSTLGEGSTFTAHIQLARGQASEVPRRSRLGLVLPSPVPAPTTTSGARPSQAPKALVVDDNVVNRLLMRKLVERLGYGVVTAENGVEALERLSGVSLVLMDVQMPVMDGLEATARLRAGEHGWLPVVAVTAQAAPGDKARCLEAGMDAYVPKPIEPDVLASAVEQALRLAAPRRGPTNGAALPRR